MYRAGACRHLVGGLLFALLAGVATGQPTLDYEPNPPGSYTLQRIMAAGDGAVVDTRGQPRRLRDFVRGRITLLSFIYSSCADPDGCPYAYTVFNLVKAALERESVARGRVRLVSLSFDPARDTPEQLALYGGPEANRRAPVRWDYLTTGNLPALLPILRDYGQDVTVEVDAVGRSLGTFSHVLKVFLIDRRGMVREIYTTAYLTPAVVINDIKTLLLEEGARS